MALPGAGKRLKPPKGKGQKFRDTSAQVFSVLSSMPSSQDDPAGVTMLQDVGIFAAAGASFAGPVGGFIGAGIGLFKSIFTIGARRKAQRQRKRNAITKHREQKQLLDTRFVEGRLSQLQTAGRSVRSSKNQWETYLHQSLGEELKRAKAPPRPLSFSQTGRIAKISSAQYSKILLAQSTVIAGKASDKIRSQAQTLEEIEKLKDDINRASKDIEETNLRFDDIDSSNIDKAYKHSKAYNIAKDKGRIRKIEQRLEDI